MTIRYQKNVDPGAAGNGKKTTEPRAERGKDDTCRCKETSKMTPRELLRLMMNDLAFWKKEKKE